MNLTEITERQEQIRAELRRFGTDQATSETADGDLVDDLIDEYGRLTARRAALLRLRIYHATRPALTGSGSATR